MKIFIIGFMASGKTTLGRILADKLNMPFHDIDQEIELQEKMTIKQIFARSEERHFRQLESEMLNKITDEAVYSCGGGIICSQFNRSTLSDKADLIIWLNPDWKVIYDRLSVSDRPLAIGKNSKQLLELYEQRLPLYSSIADIEYRGTDLNELLKEIYKISK